MQRILSEIPKQLLQYNDDAASHKPAPDKWSKKEILGHLIDSASNNHQRFVRMQIENMIELPQYIQDEWVKTQKYNSRKWNDIIELWKQYNTHLLHVLKNIDESKLNNTATFPEKGVLTLQFLINDYVAHMEHHFKQIFI